MNKRYTCGYASYIGKCYISCGAEYSASYYRLYNVNQVVTYGAIKDRTPISKKLQETTTYNCIDTPLNIVGVSSRK